MQLHQEHPSLEKLHAFAEGYLEEAELVSIQNHIAHCSSCLEKVKEIPADAFAMRLREAVGRSVGEDFQGENPLHDDSQMTSAFLNHPRYLIRKKLGAGGMGTVYLAEHRLMRRPVALKVISQRLLSHPDALSRFQNEIQAIAQLAHPGIAVAHDAEEMGGSTILIMEFIEGLDLGRYVEKHGPLPVAKACNYILQAARALQHAHERGLIHRDIKPHNLMLTPDSRIKVLDFGLAFLGDKPNDQASPTESARETPFPGDLLTDIGQGVGTPAYAAPEQVRDAHTVDARADIYSLGATLFYLLTGKTHPTARDISCPEIPPNLGFFLSSMVARSPAERPASMDEVIRELGPWEKDNKGWQLNRRLLFGAMLVPAAGVVGMAAWNWVASQNQLLTARNTRIFDAEGSPVRALAITKDGSRVVAGGADGKVRVWDVSTGKRVARIEGHRRHVLAVSLSADDKWVLSSADGDPLVRMWELETGQPLGTFQGDKNGMHAVAISRDGRYVASGVHTVMVWNRETGQRVAQLKKHFAGVMGIQFLPDGEHVLTCANDHGIYLWNIRGQNVVHSYQGHTDEVMAMELSPDGEKILTGGHDGTVRIWNTDTGAQLHLIDGEMNVTSVSFVPGETQVLFGGWIGEKARELRVWDVVENRIIVRFLGHEGRVSCCRMFSEGRKAISGSEDGTVRLWEW